MAEKIMVIDQKRRERLIEENRECLQTLWTHHDGDRAQLFVESLEEFILALMYQERVEKEND